MPVLPGIVRPSECIANEQRENGARQSQSQTQEQHER